MSDDLENLDIDTDESAVNFFADDDIEVDVDEPKKKPEGKKKEDEESEEDDEGKKKPEGKTTADEEEDDEDITFFGSEEDDDEEEEGDDEGDDDDDDDSKKKKPASKVEGNSVATLNFLKEKGLIEFELEDGEELDEDRAIELLEDSMDESVEKAIEDKLGSLPDAIKELNKFVINGGDPAQFLSSLVQSPGSKIQKDMDMSKEENQEIVMKERLKAQGYDDDYIKTQLDFLKDSKKLEEIAGKEYNKWETDFKEQQKTLAQKQADAKLKRKEAIRDSKKRVTKMLSENPEVGGIEFTSKEVKEMPDYMHEPAYRLDNGREISEMEKDLMEAMKDETQMTILAKMLKSKFDFQSFKQDASSKVSKKVKDNLRRNKQGEVSRKVKTNKSKDLASYFN